jgi:hypothetical protein
MFFTRAPINQNKITGIGFYQNKPKFLKISRLHNALGNQTNELELDRKKTKN